MKKRSGFTLVELIVTLVISAICIGVIGSILISSMNLINHEGRSDEQKQISIAMSDFVRSVTDMAESIAAQNTLPSALEEGETCLYIGDENGISTAKGYLWYGSEAATGGDAVMIFPRSFYKNMTASMDISQKQTAATGIVVVKERIHLYRDNNEVYVAEHTFQLINWDTKANWTGDVDNVSTSQPYYLIIEAVGGGE